MTKGDKDISNSQGGGTQLSSSTEAQEHLPGATEQVEQNTGRNSVQMGTLQLFQLLSTAVVHQVLISISPGALLCLPGAKLPLQQLLWGQ